MMQRAECLLRTRLPVLRALLVVLVTVLYAPGSPEAEVRSAQEIAQRLKPSVVAVSVQVEIYRRFWLNDAWSAYGSGFVFRKDDKGYLWILTNSHVLGLDDIANSGGASAPRLVTYRLSVQMADGAEAEIVQVLEHEELDAAILVVKAQGSNHKALAVAQHRVQVGDPVYAMGHPLGVSFYFTRGIVSMVDDEEGVIGTDAAINTGNSGGPLVNDKGQVVGVNTFKLEGEALGFAVQIGRLLDLDRYIEFDFADPQAVERHLNELYFKTQ